MVERYVADNMYRCTTLGALLERRRSGVCDMERKSRDGRSHPRGGRSPQGMDGDRTDAGNWRGSGATAVSRFEDPATEVFGREPADITLRAQKMLDRFSAQLKRIEHDRMVLRAARDEAVQANRAK